MVKPTSSNPFEQTNESGGPSTSPTQSLESMLAPNTNLQVKHAATTPGDPGKPNFDAVCQQNERAVAGALEQNLRTAASFAKEMQQRAGEALAAEKVCGGVAFEAKMETPQTGIELVASAKTGLFTGMGSMTTGGKGFQAAASSTAEAMNVMADKTISTDDARAEVSRILAASSSPAEESLGPLVQADAPGRVDVGIDWQPVIDTYGVEAIVAAVEFDINNPSDMFPEVQGLVAAIGEQRTELEQLQQQNSDNSYSAAGVEVAGELPNGFPLAVGPMDVAALDSVERDAILAGTKNDPVYGNEPSLEFKQEGMMS